MGGSLGGGEGGGLIEVLESMGRWMDGWIKENEAVRMSYCTLCMGGWEV